MHFQHQLHKTKWNSNSGKQKSVTWTAEYDEQGVYFATIYILFCRPQRFGSGYFRGHIAIVDVMGGITAFTDFKGLFPMQLMANDSAGHFFGLLGHWQTNNGYTGHQEGHCCDLVTIISPRDNMRHTIMPDPSAVCFSCLCPDLYLYLCCFLAEQIE